MIVAEAKRGMEAGSALSLRLWDLLVEGTTEEEAAMDTAKGGIEELKDRLVVAASGGRLCGGSLREEGVGA